MKSLKQFKESLDQWNGNANLSILNQQYNPLLIESSIHDFNTNKRLYKEILESYTDDDIVVLAKPKSLLYQEDVDYIRLFVKNKKLTINESVINVRKHLDNGFQNKKIDFVLENGDCVLIDIDTILRLQESDISLENIRNAKELMNIILETLEE